jgi:hypothetical protein
MGKSYPYTKILLIITLSFVFSGCASPGSRPHAQRHLLVGAWKAADDTIFIFRNDGTFHGVDCHKIEIWGNWVSLAPNRIGFQSLRHDSFYKPQYAVISKNENAMNYIVTGGTRFIKAERITIKQAEAAIEKVLVGKIILPAVEE